MHRYFIAAVVTCSVIITAAFAAPARAENNDLAKVLAGIAALAIVGKVIHDRKDKDHVTHNYNTHKPHNLNVHRHHNHNFHKPHGIKPKPLPHRVSRRTLPAHCIRHFETRHGKSRRVFGARCLDRNYRFAHQLPRNCARQIETHRGWRWVYGARCLRNNGYQIARY